MKFQTTQPIFDYRALRLVLGIIAFTLPFLVTWVARTPLPSISASYHTGARDWFVGLLFVVGALLWAYNGHSTKDAVASKGASICAVLVALFPTAAEECGSNEKLTAHGAAAVTLFVILAYFCFGPFRENIKGKGGKKGIRAKLYFACGTTMVVCMLAGLLGKLFLSCETLVKWSVVYWVEAIALVAFGIAWIVAGKIIPWLVEKTEALELSWR